jgi:hypothetical protein
MPNVLNSVILAQPGISLYIMFSFIYNTTPTIRTLVIRIANYPDRLGPSCNFVKNSAKLICLEITGYRIE